MVNRLCEKGAPQRPFSYSTKKILGGRQSNVSFNISIFRRGYSKRRNDFC